jgi:protein-histidine pros-kinase
VEHLRAILETTIEGKFQRLLEAAPDAMMVVDQDGRVVLVNAQAGSLFGYSRDELLGQPVEMLVPERYRQRHAGHRHRYAGSPHTRPMGGTGVSLFGLRKDGSEFPVEVSLSPFPTEEGTLVISAIRDLTLRQRAEEERARLRQAEEAVRLRDEFLSIAAHELRTPLTLLQMQSELLLRMARERPGDELVERLKARSEGIHRATRRLNRLVGQLLDVSRITASKLLLEQEEVDLSALVRAVAEQMEDVLARAGCELRFGASTVVAGHWDPLRLEQVVTNLLSNAAKYGQGQPIEVEVDLAAPGQARLTVRDHGIGIAAEDQPRIFERFERVVSDRSHAGFGLGLWISRAIVEAHGGTLRVTSEPGVGSCFIVELPREPALPG